jgi:hypothetical protein
MILVLNKGRIMKRSFDIGTVEGRNKVFGKQILVVMLESEWSDPECRVAP